MENDILFIRINTFKGNNQTNYQLNGDFYHIDKLVKALNRTYSDEKWRFLTYEVYKEDKIQHSGKVLVRRGVDFRELLSQLSLNNFVYLFKLKKVLKKSSQENHS